MQDYVTDINHNGDNGRNSEGSFIKLKDGRVMFIYTRYNSPNWDDHCTADLVAVYSSDGGKTWSDWKLVIRNRAQNVMSVSLLRLQDGRIALAYLEKAYKNRQLNPPLPNDPGIVDCRPYFRTSSDEGETWTEAVDVCKNPPQYTVLANDRMVQLKSGRIILPVAIHRAFTPKVEKGKLLSDICHPQGTTHFYLSDDGGDSWREAAQCCFPPQWLSSGLREPGVIELEDNKLMAWFRTNDKSQYKAFSSDGGETWTACEPAREFLSVESPLSMKRDPKNGELVAVWCDLDPRWNVQRTDASWGRTPLVIARSADNGRTWKDHKVIEDAPDHGFCYIAMLFDDDALLLAYCCGGGNSSVLQDLRIRRIR